MTSGEDGGPILGMPWYSSNGSKREKLDSDFWRHILEGRIVIDT